MCQRKGCKTFLLFTLNFNQRFASLATYKEINIITLGLILSNLGYIYIYIYIYVVLMETYFHFEHRYDMLWNICDHWYCNIIIFTPIPLSPQVLHDKKSLAVKIVNCSIFFFFCGLFLSFGILYMAACETMKAYPVKEEQLTRKINYTPTIVKKLCISICALDFDCFRYVHKDM